MPRIYTARPGATMTYWLAETLRAERELLGIVRADAARSLRVSDRTLERLEAGQKMPPEIEAYVAGYAYLLGLEDGRELWRQALARWQQHGAPPAFEPHEGLAVAFAQAIRDSALRQRQDGAARPADRAANPKRKRAAR